MDETPRRPCRRCGALRTEEEYDKQRVICRDCLGHKHAFRGWVYVMVAPEHPDIVKIGRTDQPKKRLQGINCGHPFSAIKYAGKRMFDNCVEAEKAMHGLFSEARIPGGEWFKVPPKEALAALREL
jgi:hypothetical protein